ncbi:MAG: cyclase family protein [Gemmatimonadaceae bacterium]|nr:cyclase family protein [Gemmatimonadaceae bacterium]
MSDAGFIDISITLAPGTPEWPGDTPFSCGWTWRIADGASVNLSAITTSPHVGTHADAPLHVRNGAAASDALPLDVFIGEAVVLDVTMHRGELDRAALRAAGLTRTPTRLLLKTGRSSSAGAFPEAWPALTPDCAAALVTEGLRLLGVDCPSVDLRESQSLAVHHALFDGGAYNLENLDLSIPSAGPYHLIAAPLKLGALDAAPVRAVLRPLSSVT